MQHSRERPKSVLTDSPKSAHLVLSGAAPHYPILAESGRYTHVIGAQTDQVVGRGLFELWSEELSRQRLSQSLNTVARTQASDSMTVAVAPADATEPGGSVSELLRVTHIPGLDREGALLYIIHSVEAVPSERVRDSVLAHSAMPDPQLCKECGLPRQNVRLTDRVAEMTQTLHASETRLDQVSRFIDDALVFRDRSGGRVVFASASFATLFGRSPDALVSSQGRWLDWILDEDRERVAEAYAALKRGEPFAQEYRIQLPDGEIRWVRARCHEIVEGDLEREVEIVQNISQQRKLQLELEHSHRMEVVGTLASGVAHDMGNVLQGVIGCLELAGGAPDISPSAGYQIRLALDTARRGGRLVQHLMNFARKDVAARGPLALDSFLLDLWPIVQRLVTEQIEVVVEANARDAVVMADAMELEQILLNLTANARDAMPDGGRLAIQSRTCRRGREASPGGNFRRGADIAQLIVRDTGTGMSEETVRRAFEPYFTTKGAGDGTGFGLSTVYARVKDLGGHLEIASALGEGTEVVVELPCHLDAAETRVSHELESSERLSPPAHRVLLVEDDPVVRTTLQSMLESLGLHVSVADGVEAEGAAVDLLICDVRLPTKRGPQLATALRERNPDLAVLFVSATTNALSDADLDGAGVLRKPFDRAALVDALQRLLGTSAERA